MVYLDFRTGQLTTGMVKDFSQGLQTGHCLINLTADARIKDRFFFSSSGYLYIRAVLSSTVLGLKHCYRGGITTHHYQSY